VTSNKELESIGDYKDKSIALIETLKYTKGIMSINTQATPCTAYKIINLS
jgi:hypothetical protein